MNNILRNNRKITRNKARKRGGKEEKWKGRRGGGTEERDHLKRPRTWTRRK